jgi:hypothetical protein
VKREHENTYLKAQKMMRGKVEPFAVPIVVRAMPPMVQAIKQTTTIPHMTSPHDRQQREQKWEIPHMTSPQKRQLREQS